jgi:archaellum biogenesis protein FlaJ (TadC family)
MSLEQQAAGSDARRRARTRTYTRLMPSHDRWHRIHVGLVVALVLILAGVVVDSLLSASWVLDDGLLLAAAAVIALALLLTRGRGRAEAK